MADSGQRLTESVQRLSDVIGDPRAAHRRLIEDIEKAVAEIDSITDELESSQTLVQRLVGRVTL